MSTEYLLLKWGTIKGWKIENPATLSILQEWSDLGSSMSAMVQKDTPEQKVLICKLIDAINGDIVNDWSGETYTKEQAKEYILNYGK
jgi:hypothetical protein